MSKSKLPLLTSYYLMKRSAEEFRNLVMQKYKNNRKEFEDITYGQVYEKIQEIGIGLLSLGLAKGEPVVLIADVGHKWMWCSMGINNIGGVDVPRGTDATEGDLQYILSHSESRFIIFENIEAFNKIKNEIKNLTELKFIIFYEKVDVTLENIEILTLDELMIQGRKRLDEEPEIFKQLGEDVNEDDLETIIYTSGTTGEPKGVMVTNKSLTWEVETLSRQLETEPGISTMGFLPPWHIAERLIETNNLYSGGYVAFTSIPSLASDLKKINPIMLVSVPRVWENFYNKIEDSLKNSSSAKQLLFNTLSNVATDYAQSVDNVMGRQFRLKKQDFYSQLADQAKSFVSAAFLFLPNQIAQTVLKKVKESLGNQLRFAFSGAGALPIHIDRFFNAIGVPILEAYGMTETCGVSCLRSVDHVVIGTVGKTLPGVEIKLLDNEGNTITEPGVKGIAWHRGPHIMKGYFKEPEKTSQVLIDGWLDSGDIMVWTSGGELKFAGRAKDTIVLLGGENLEPEPIERVLVQSPLIDQIVVVGQDRKTLGALIVVNQEQLQLQLKSQNTSTSLSDLNNSDEIRKLIKGDIKSRISSTTGFKGFEKITTFYLLTNEFEVGVELTQTMKVKRNVVFEKYAREINLMYK